jgi:hypothetical protein
VTATDDAPPPTDDETEYLHRDLELRPGEGPLTDSAPDAAGDGYAWPDLTDGADTPIGERYAAALHHLMTEFDAALHAIDDMFQQAYRKVHDA